MLTEIIALTILRADTLPSIYPVTQMNSTMKRSNILGGAFANQAGLAITSSQTELRVRLFRCMELEAFNSFTFKTDLHLIHPHNTIPES